MSVKDFIRGIRAAVMYEDEPVYTYQRECHISAGYAYKRPSRNRDYTTVICIGLAAVCIAVLIWLAKTPAGNQLGYRIGDYVWKITEGMK